jgi:hypothetical protein
VEWGPEENAGAPEAPAGVQEKLIDLTSYRTGERTFLRRRIVNATVHKPPPINASDPGSGMVGPGLEEKVPVPEALNGPAAGNAWLRITVPTAKFGISEERLHDASSWVWPAKFKYAEVNTSWLRFPAVALALKLPPLLPMLELNWAPVVAGLPVTAKVPDSRLVPGKSPASVNENVPWYPGWTNESPGPQLTPQLPTWLLVAVSVNVAASDGPNGTPGTENVKSTEPVAVTVVLLPDVSTLHCCVFPLSWLYWANVTGAALAEPNVITAKANVVQTGPVLFETLIFIVEFLLR